VKYAAYASSSPLTPLLIQRAHVMASFLLTDSLSTPLQHTSTGLSPAQRPAVDDDVEWPAYPRSSGIWITGLPLNCSSQFDVLVGGCETIEPDKGALVAFALLQLHALSPNDTYLTAAISIADVLVQHMDTSAANYSSPWPFRVDFDTGEPYGQRSAQIVYALRLFDDLIGRELVRFQEPRRMLWNWFLQYQLPTITHQGSDSLWVCFYEDMCPHTDVETDRVGLPAMDLARYLLEKQDAIDPQWLLHTQTLLNYTWTLFSQSRPYYVTVMGEQDNDHKPWGGANSRLSAISALYAYRTGSSAYHDMAVRGLAWWTYFVDNDGCPSAKEDGALKPEDRGGWQEDAHTDVVHNIVDTLAYLKLFTNRNGQR